MQVRRRSNVKNISNEKRFNVLKRCALDEAKPLSRFLFQTDMIDSLRDETVRLLSLSTRLMPLINASITLLKYTYH